MTQFISEIGAMSVNVRPHAVLLCVRAALQNYPQET